MRLRSYITIVTIGTLSCWLAFVSIIKNLTPADAGALGWVFFYFSFVVAMIGTCFSAGTIIRYIRERDELVVFRQLRDAFRQALVVTATVTVLLILQGARLLAWWNGFLLITASVLLEWSLSARRRHKNTYGV